MCGTRPGPPSHKRLKQQLCELTDHKHPGQRALPFKAEVPQNGRKARAVDSRLSVRTPRTEQPRRSPWDGQPGASRSRLDSTGAQRIAELDRAD